MCRPLKKKAAPTKRALRRNDALLPEKRSSDAGSRLDVAIDNKADVFGKTRLSEVRHLDFGSLDSE
jgi:hypothetical protein